MSLDPDNLTNLLDKIPSSFFAVALAMFTAVVRVIYDKEETKLSRIALESILCGALTMTAWAGITALGWHESWSVAAGGTIGFIGSMSVRLLALRFLRKKTK